MSGRRELMLARRAAKDPLDTPITFTATQANSAFTVTYYAANSTLPRDDIYYRVGTTGDWIQYDGGTASVTGATLTLPNIGDVIQVKCISPYWGKGTTTANMRRFSRVSGGFTITGNIRYLFSSLAEGLTTPASCLVNAFYGMGSNAKPIILIPDEPMYPGSYAYNGLLRGTGAVSVDCRWSWDNWPSSRTSDWLTDTPAGGTFYKKSILPIVRNTDHIPANWTVIETDVNQNIPYTETYAITQTDSQYIDTGIIGRSGLTIEVIFTLNANTATDNDVLGVFGNGYELSAPCIQGGSHTVVYNYITGHTIASNLATDTIYQIRCVARPGNQKLFQDLVQKYTASDSTEFSTGQPIYLFCRNDNGVAKTTDTTKATIHSARIWDEDKKLLFDGVPVKDDNDKIATWDTVGQRLLYSADGTDFAEVYPKPQGAWIKNGLHLHYDFFNNTGNGGVNSAARYWKDLIGSNNIPDISSSAFSWKNKRLERTVSDNTARPHSSIKVWDTAGDCTVEIVFFIGANNQNFWAAGQRDVNQEPAFWQIARYNSDLLNMSIYGTPYNANSGVAWHIADSVATMPTNGCTAAFTIKYGTDLPKGYLNGVELSPYAIPTVTATYTRNTSSHLNLMSVGFNSVGINAPGGVYGVRIYDRVLTAEEIAYNAQIDRDIYGIGS